MGASSGLLLGSGRAHGVEAGMCLPPVFHWLVLIDQLCRNKANKVSDLLDVAEGVRFACSCLSFLFQLIMQFQFFLQDGREKSFLSWAQKWKGRSARAVGCQTGFLSLWNACKGAYWKFHEVKHRRGRQQVWKSSSSHWLFPSVGLPCKPHKKSCTVFFHSLWTPCPFSSSIHSLGGEGNPPLYGMGYVCLSFSQLPNSGISCSIIHFLILPRT